MEERKDEFLSQLFPSVAAQMRNLLGSLRLASIALAPPELRDQDPDLDRRAARLDQSYYQILRLVTDLTAAGLLVDHRPLRLQDGDLVELVRNACAHAEEPAHVLGLDLQFFSTVPADICAFDPMLMESLLYHLLSNAFKFTPAGGKVTVEIRQLGRQVLLSVSDTGRGIDAAHLNTLFDRYLHQEVLDPPPHGLGLGLTLCQRIAEGHGGSLLAESEVGVGSRFTLSIPDRRVGDATVSDVATDYAGGFNPTLLALADALPPEAFLQRHIE